MIVFRTQHAHTTSVECLNRIRSLALQIDNRHGHAALVDMPSEWTVLELLIEFGEFETAVTDAICRDRDCDAGIVPLLRDASLLIGRAYMDSCDCRKIENGRQILAAVEKISQTDMPTKIDIRISEGYAYYSLYPECYIEAARIFARDHRPESVLILGLRSIGTSLSAVVWAAMERCGVKTYCRTLRPRSGPYTRRVSIDPAYLKSMLGTNPQYVAIVDEGPGLSGSSICGVAQLLIENGIGRERIMIFPSWIPGGSDFKNDDARQLWPQLPHKFVVSFEDSLLKNGRLIPAGAEYIDFSGGEWRKYIFKNEAEFPAVHPHHERRKYLVSDGGRQFLYKFAGLGRYGREKFERAKILAQAGFSPEPLDLRRGFIISRFESGAPMEKTQADDQFLERLGEYLFFTQKSFPARRSVTFDYLCHMIYHNIYKSIGPEYLAACDKFPQVRSLIENAPASAIDARMLMHEWIAGPGGIFKTDSAFHFSDHFFPGCADITWDMAAAMTEFDLSEQARQFLLNGYIKLSGDGEIRNRLPFYMLAWTAFRIGVATFGYNQFGSSPEGERFRLLVNRYADTLKSVTKAFDTGGHK
jgi:hypothetical protein